MTDYEWKLMQSDQSPVFTEKAAKLKTYLANLESKPFDDSPDDWITTIENITPILATGLLSSDDKNGNFISKLAMRR